MVARALIVTIVTATACLLSSCAHDLGDCRRSIIAVSIEPCAEICAGPPGPPAPALGIAIMFDGSVQCRCVAPESPMPGVLRVAKPHAQAPAPDPSVLIAEDSAIFGELVSVPEEPVVYLVADDCPTGCTEAKASCLEACAHLRDAAYCERTCGALYSRCQKRCARAAKEDG